jgi:hypothetical protein
VSAPFSTPGDDWDQGDIVAAAYFPGLDSKLPAVLVTPACDLEHEKVALWTLIALFPDTLVAKDIVRREGESLGTNRDGLLVGPTPKQVSHLERKIRDLMRQRFHRYHWLPVRINDQAGHVADFSCVTSLPVDEVRLEAQRLFSMNSSWREELPARYAAYIGRVGVDDCPDAESHVGRLVADIVPDR